MKKKKLRKEKIIGYKCVAVARQRKWNVPHPLGSKYWIPAIMKVEIPTDARVVYPDRGLIGEPVGKFRAERAFVVEIRSLHGKRLYQSAVNWMGVKGGSYRLEYQAGTMAISDGFERRTNRVCGPGINCFLTKKEALGFMESYSL